MGVHCWESKSEGFDPKHESEKCEGSGSRVNERGKGMNMKVSEYVNSVINARCLSWGDPKGSIYIGG
jgi:hypothetical protein